MTVVAVLALTITKTHLRRAHYAQDRSQGAAGDIGVARITHEWFSRYHSLCNTSCKSQILWLRRDEGGETAGEL